MLSDCDQSGAYRVTILGREKGGHERHEIHVIILILILVNIDELLIIIGDGFEIFIFILGNDFTFLEIFRANGHFI